MPHLPNYKFCELVKVSYSSTHYFLRLLLLNLIKSWCDRITDRSLYNNTLSEVPICDTDNNKKQNKNTEPILRPGPRLGMG